MKPLRISRRETGHGGNPMPAMPEIDQALRPIVEAGAVPGLVAIAATGDSILYENAFGRRAVDGDAPMAADSVFYLASMTKAITVAAGMQLVEQGRLSLDAPIGDVLPELSAPQILEGFDDNGAPLLRPARRRITLRQLMTHTSGHAYEMWHGNLARYIAQAGIPSIFTCTNAALRTPLVAEPGTAWNYGIGIDWVGKAVEAVSGQDLDTYLREHLFAPLGMTDTGFRLSPGQKARRVGVHARQEDGSLAVMPLDLPDPPEFWMGGGGLFGTGRDYVRFLRMILGGGSLDGNRVLRPETVAAMAQNHIGDIVVEPMATVAPQYSTDVDLCPGQAQKWGLSFLVNTETTAEGRSPGSLSWAGLCNTHYWIDPARDVCGVVMTQILPFCDDGAMRAYRAFERGLYQALGNGRRAA
jgi:CubicO group peptidase (beta-lactamase class C family)